MNSRTFLATAATWLCILPNIDAVTTSQNVENLGFGVELILAKLEQLENRIMMLEQHVNTSLKAMLNLPCSAQSGRLDVDGDDSWKRYPFPTFPTRKNRYDNRPTIPGYEYWKNNNSSIHLQYFYNGTESFGSNDSPRLDVDGDDSRKRYPFPTFPTRKNRYNADRPTIPGYKHWRNNNSDIHDPYSYNRTEPFGTYDSPILDVDGYDSRKRYPFPTFPTRKNRYNTDRPTIPGYEHWRNNNSGIHYQYSYNRTLSFGSDDLPRPMRPIPPNDPFLRPFIDEDIPSRDKQ